MKKTIKKILLILIIFTLLLSISTEVFGWSQIIKDGKGFISTGETATDIPMDTDKINEGMKGLSGYLYNLLLSAGVIIAVVVATVLGIQFMMGGAEGQAKVKEMLVPFVVGCIVVFGGFGIWKIAMVIGDKIESVDTVKPDTSNVLDNMGQGIEMIKPK